MADTDTDNPSSGELVRNDRGQFVKGTSGNPVGRPKGSKNKITLLKLAAEEAVREDNLDDMLQVCRQVINDALEGDKSARKLVWDAMISKMAHTEDKTGGAKSAIIVETMTVNQNRNSEAKADDSDVLEGDYVVTTNEDETNG